MKTSMDNTRFLQLGWVLFAALGAVVLAGGFQGQTEKVGVVDITKVIEGSDFGKTNQATFTAMQTAREQLLDFIDNNRVMTLEQAVALRDLMLKPTRTPEEDAKLESMKADAVAQTKRWQALNTKSDISAEERTLMEEYAKRAQTMNDQAQKWVKEFTNEMQTWADRQKLASLAKAKESIQSVAKTQGFSYVLESSVAPYGANDLSDAALQDMNAKK